MDQQKMTVPTNPREQARLRAEARAQAAVANAEALAEAAVATADARARELIAAHSRRTQALTARLLAAPARAAAGRRAAHEASPRIDPERLHAAVSVRAYYKAEQRRFEPGRETDDWLAAERELLTDSSATDQDVMP